MEVDSEMGMVDLQVIIFYQIREKQNCPSSQSAPLSSEKQKMIVFLVMIQKNNREIMSAAREIVFFELRNKLSLLFSVSARNEPNPGKI